MKISRNGLLAVVSVAALALILGAHIQAQAQTITTSMSVQIPFDFNVGNKSLPAGSYIVEKRGDALSIRGRSGNSAYVLINGVQNLSASQGSLLVFNRYWNSYFLSEARWEDRAIAGHLIQVPSEIALARKTPSEPTTIAALVR